MSAKAILTPEQLEALRRIDSATIANAIEKFDVRPRTSGFTGTDIKALFPDLGVTVGYAVTLTQDAQTEGVEFDRTVWWDVLKAIDASPKPVVLVSQDVSPRRTHSCHFGDGMANLTHRLGAVALVTDGGVRDLPGIRELGFRLFAPGVVPAHGTQRIVSANHPVEISGLRIEPGDLIHADENGVVLIPAEIADLVAEAAHQVLADEAKHIGFWRGADFSLDEVGRRLGVIE